MPSSPALAEAIARQIDPHAGTVLEIGPGTGVVTEAILERGIPADRLTLVEYDEDMARHLAERLPRAHVIQGDAFDLDRLLGPRYSTPFGGFKQSGLGREHSMHVLDHYTELKNVFIATD